MERFREQNGSKPRFLSFYPIRKPSLSRKFRSRHLSLAMTLLKNVESTVEELGMDDEARASCLCFVLHSCSLSQRWSFGGSFFRSHLGF